MHVIYRHLGAQQGSSGNSGQDSWCFYVEPAVRGHKYKIEAMTIHFMVVSWCGTEEGSMFMAKLVDVSYYLQQTRMIREEARSTVYCQRKLAEI